MDVDLHLELRVDYMERPNLIKLISHSSLPKIVTVRARDEGGESKGSEDERFECLQKAIDLGVEYVDVELKHLR